MILGGAAAVLVAALASHVGAQTKEAEAPGQKTTRGAILKIANAAPRAYVKVDGVGLGRVDAKGSRSFDAIPAGKHTVVVRQVGFVDERQTLTMAAFRTTTVTPKRVPIADEAEFALQRADDLRLDGKNAQAVEEYQKAIKAYKGTFVDAQIGLARAYVTLKKSEEALEAITAALEAAPSSVEVHTVHGIILREKGFYDEAARAYEKAISLSPDHSPEPHTGLALVREDQGRLDDAAAEWETAIGQNFDSDPILYQLLGNVYEQLENREGALTAYRKFLKLAPKHALAPAVRSLVSQLEDTTGDDVNPYAPKDH
jgi:Flp pilus assembly protein TadD